MAGSGETLRHGAVTIAAITSCTNTSNPSVMVGAGLVAQKAAARGLRVPAYVKTSLAPGSRVVRGAKREFISRSYNLILRRTLSAGLSAGDSLMGAVIAPGSYPETRRLPSRWWRGA